MSRANTADSAFRRRGKVRKLLHLREMEHLVDDHLDLLPGGCIGALTIRVKQFRGCIEGCAERSWPATQCVNDRTQRYERRSGRLIAAGADNATDSPPFQIAAPVATQILDVVDGIFNESRYGPVITGMQKIVQRMRKEIGLPVEFTLDACRHGGMTELEEAELTEGQGRALSAHRTKESYAGYAKRTEGRMMSATRKRHAHRLANETATSVQNATGDHVQNENPEDSKSA